MKKLITTAQYKFTHWLFERIELFKSGKPYRFDLNQTRLVERFQQGNGIAILDKSMYVAFERRYKVISQKELKGIVENEKNYHSPFKTGYALYKTTELGEGNWLVQYYFVDLDVYPEVEHYTVVLIWEEVLISLIGDKSKAPVKVSSPMGEQLIVAEDNTLRISNIVGSGLKNRVLLTEPLDQTDVFNIEGAEFANRILSYIVTLQWTSVHGVFNHHRFSRKSHDITFNPKVLALGGGIVAAAMSFESVYLLGMDYYLENEVQRSAELRNDYSNAKGKYLRGLDEYSDLAIIVSSKSNAGDIPRLLSQLPDDLKLRIDRMDYIGGEVRIGGISGNIEALMAYLANHPQVDGLDFMSPITPDKKSGQDRFLIRFDFKHG